MATALRNRAALSPIRSRGAGEESSGAVEPPAAGCTSSPSTAGSAVATALVLVPPLCVQLGPANSTVAESLPISADVASRHPRPRRYIQPDRVWVLKVVGFRYAHWRGEYILRVIGNRVGPVYRVAYTRKLAGADRR